MEEPDFEEVIEEIEELEIEEDGLPSSVQTLRKRESFERITKPVLGRYAKAKLIAVRARKLELNQPSTIPRSQLRSTEPQKIAQQELEEKKIPLKVIRKLPDGTYEEWRISEFKYIAR